MSAALQDDRGCLTAAGIAALARAPLGQAAPELASHLASCGRCQDRLLAGALAGTRRGAVKPPPPRWRAWAVLAAAVLLTLVALVLNWWLTPR